MNIVENSLSFVLVGEWSGYYLNPVWFTQNIFNNSLINIDIDGKGNNFFLKIYTEEYMVELPNEKIIFRCLKSSSCDIQKFEEICNSFLTKTASPYIQAYGINIAFETEEENLIDIFDNIEDNSKLYGKSATIKNTKINRTIEYKDNLIFYKLSNDGNKTKFEFNQHVDIGQDSSKLSTITGKISSFKSDMIDFMNIYTQD